ncbi:hypothetical protein [Arthrobacter sp. NEB 688]|uniref:hypothetical protein n=1 Tax=Arthrobacter sp. NEB 688 TaxID=904039 RepID=UPI0015678315|nr:hypothetical protein [Arthrobacter sp. NEB 688]QKE82878.1 hypothetical protein HL663_02210 [Arthrobacter sp. NEB 688]
MTDIFDEYDFPEEINCPECGHSSTIVLGRDTRRVTRCLVRGRQGNGEPILDKEWVTEEEHWDHVECCLCGWRDHDSGWLARL